MVRAWRPLGPESSGRLVKVCHNTGHDINKLINDAIWELPVINQNVEVVSSTTITRTWTTEDSIKTTKNWQDVKMVKQQQINNNSKSTTASQQQQQQQHCLFWKQWKWSNKKKHNKTATISTTESTASHKKVDSNICFWHLGVVTNSISETITTHKFYNFMWWLIVYNYKISHSAGFVQLVMFLMLN